MKGEIVITHGEFQHAKIEITDLGLDAKIDLGVAKLAGKQTFDIPSLMTIPFSAGGFPLYAQLSASVSFESTGTEQTAILGTAKFNGT